MRNPLTLKTSSSFTFTTRDQYWSLIDERKTGVTVKMNKNANFRSSSLQLTSYRNSEKAKYTFTIVPSIPLADGNVVQITFPK